MHYDEAIHVHYAWRLASSEGGLWGWPWIFGRDYIHAPWMHGPFQIEFTALTFRLFGDTDFTARLGYVLFGTALVALPYFLRDYLGRAGALLAAVMLMLSPALLYFSRFGREDILMAFWATALLVLLWRYIHEGKNRYLYLASAVLAFMFATKETAYFVVLIFGAILFLLALPDLVPWALGRVRLPDLAGPAGFLLLLVTLTLPQWSPASGLAQDVLGLTLVNPDPQTGRHVPNLNGSQGLVGAPAWAGPLQMWPVYDAPRWFHGVALVLLAAGLLWFSGRRAVTARSLLAGVGVPLLVVAAMVLLLRRPIDRVLFTDNVYPVVAWQIAGALVVTAVGLLAWLRPAWARGTLLVTVPALLTVAYLMLFTPLFNVDALVNGVLPKGVPRLDAGDNGLPVNYLVGGGVLAATFLLAGYLGVAWRGGVWLACAAIFYFIWLTLYTTFYTNWAGAFSGIWQGMGYWIAQQDVARGNQPWYYYFVGLSIYELLPVLFGLLAAAYFARRGDIFGLVLAAWAGLTLLAYTVASEKMPWLLVHVTLPFTLLAGKYLGELAERVPWRRIVPWEHLGLLVLTPLEMVLGVYLLYHYVGPPGSFSGVQWILLAAASLLAVALVYLVRLAGPRAGVPLVGLGVALLLLGFGVFVSFRAVYTYDDSSKEMLVYAQGSADLPATFQKLDRALFSTSPPAPPVEVDYDLWYPFGWYVRHQQKAGRLRFGCFKAQGEDGWNAGCRPLLKEPQAPAFLLSSRHGARDASFLSGYRQEGPYRNLLWFPESYRRPGENRHAEGIQEELARDWEFFKQMATRRDSWRDTLDYLILRKLDRDWFNSEYYSFLPR
jgi:predicted membrane-bound mannosyltransferase